MKKSTAKTIKALVGLGLNTFTGTSGIINLSDIESKSKLRQVSNGAKIIRDDQYPFSCFKISRTYDDANNLIAVKFNGFRDVQYERETIKNNIQKKKDKIMSMLSQVQEQEMELESLEMCNPANILYCESDVLTFVKFSS